MAREQPLTHYARNIVFDCTANLRFWPIAAIGNAEIHAYLIAALGWIAELHLLQLQIAASDPKSLLENWVDNVLIGPSAPKVVGYKSHLNENRFDVFYRRTQTS